jgi:hypothetical protein
MLTRTPGAIPAPWFSLRAAGYLPRITTALAGVGFGAAGTVSDNFLGHTRFGAVDWRPEGSSR